MKQLSKSILAVMILVLILTSCGQTKNHDESVPAIMLYGGYNDMADYCAVSDEKVNVLQNCLENLNYKKTDLKDAPQYAIAFEDNSIYYYNIEEKGYTFFKKSEDGAWLSAKANKNARKCMDWMLRDQDLIF